MRKLNQYRFEIHPLAEEKGGGFLITYPDFSDCISDRETPEEAIRNGMDALYETISALEELGHPVPQPGGAYRRYVRDASFAKRPAKKSHVM